VMMFFSGRDWETSQDRVKDERSKVQRSLMKTCSRAPRTLDWGDFSPSNRTMTLSTQPRQPRNGFGRSLCPWVAQPEPGLKPNLTSLERPVGDFGQFILGFLMSRSSTGRVGYCYLISEFYKLKLPFWVHS
jgi:hypothetical protein